MCVCVCMCLCVCMYVCTTEIGKTITQSDVSIDAFTTTSEGGRGMCGGDGDGD